MNISTPSRRTALFFGLAACVLAMPTWAQNYPNKPIKFITNFPAGGPADFLARTVGEAITTQTWSSKCSTWPWCQQPPPSPWCSCCKKPSRTP
eukprot:gene23926-30210_t